MKMQGNTIFITGGTSGIGKGLAEAFHKLGNQVLISGRREDRLKGISAANPGMTPFVLDVTDAASIRGAARAAIEQFPALNVVVNNSGIQRRHNFSDDAALNDAAMVDEIQTNLLGLIRATAEFLPHLKKQAGATLLNVSSGLAFIPMPAFPVYCASKAAVNSFTLTLRQQLKNTGVKIIELIPPYVATELGGGMPTPAGALHQISLETFVAETMRELAGDEDEIAVGGARNLFVASGADKVKQIVAERNR
jgi:uncharacterized oxidoreductase